MGINVIACSWPFEVNGRAPEVGKHIEQLSVSVAAAMEDSQDPSLMAEMVVAAGTTTEDKYVMERWEKQKHRASRAQWREAELETWWWCPPGEREG